MTQVMTGTDKDISTGITVDPYVKASKLKAMEAKWAQSMDDMYEKIKALEQEIQTLRYEKPLEGGIYLGEVSHADKDYLEKLGVQPEIFTTYASGDTVKGGVGNE